MKRMTRDDVIKAVGAVDDVTIAQIIGSMQRSDELAEAQAWIVNDDPLINPAGRWRRGGFASSSIFSPSSSLTTTRMAGERPLPSDQG